MYRPDDWENPYKDHFGKAEMTLREDYETNMRFSYEAGADAMLEALRQVHSLKGFERMTEVILKPTEVE